MPDADDVLGVLTEQIQSRFQMPIAELRRAVVAAPQAHPEATTIVRWHGLLTEAQQVLNRAEDALAQALAHHVDTVPDGEFVELPEHVMRLADSVNSAHTVREGRAMTVRHLLDPQAIGNRSPGGGASMSLVKRGVGFWVRRRCRRGASRRAR
ncbi:hypothetical protein SGFS_020590 [Streptomyces graminofaciens]|uniref:Uncharacterized protein n=1 Tax=Streptomyces graminofaciens TaxID=68212 RepID=A0ABN5VCR0_9ACTN|nr:hypothetical protein SGFS_020590 [Streptomyces graminofaciens]